MPRGPRLDAAGFLHHVIARGIERRSIFIDDADRDDFVERLASIAREGRLAVYAWVLMPNHVHLLVRTGSQSLERSMRSLLSGYATRFNLRHQRAGHLFQNRYKSIVCEDEPYLLTLVRYIHQNPLPLVVPDLKALGRYPYCGHSALAGTIDRDWQATAAVLGRFGDRPSEAMRRYLDFMGEVPTAEGALDGGGLRRSRGFWSPVAELAKGRERFRSDERILGSGAFVETIQRELNGSCPPRCAIDDVVRCVCDGLGIHAQSVLGGGRTRVVSLAREAIAFLWMTRLGGSGRGLALHLGLAPSPVHRAARRGAREASRWDALWSGRRQGDKGCNVP
jgi:REP element-mobilizing transposase RayT